MIAALADAPSLPVAAQLAFAGGLLGLSLILLGRFGVPWLQRVEPAERTPQGPWNSAHLILVVGVGIVAQVIAGWLLNLYAGGRGIELADMQAGAVLLASCFWQGGLVALLLLIGRGTPTGLASLGLMPTGGRVLLHGLGVYLLALPGILASGLLWHLFLESFGGGAEAQPVQEIIARTQGLEIALAGVLAIVVIPFLEEVLFRGWLQGWIARRLDAVNGVLIPAVLFAVLHGMPVLLPIFALALVLGIVRHHTDRLAPVWAIHAAHNGSQLLLLFGAGEFQDEAASLPATGLLSILLTILQA